MKPRSLPLIIFIGCCPLLAGLAGCSTFVDHPRRAEVELHPAPGVNTRGTVTFVDNPDGVQVTYNLQGLPPDSDHGLHIHERGDCIAAGPAGLGPIGYTVSGEVLFNPYEADASTPELADASDFRVR